MRKEDAAYCDRFLLGRERRACRSSWDFDSLAASEELAKYAPSFNLVVIDGVMAAQRLQLGCQEDI